MAEEKQFTLGEDLEKLVRSFGSADNYYRQAVISPGIDNTQLRESAEQAYQNPMMTELNPASFLRVLRNERNTQLEHLDQRIDSATFSSAKTGLTKGLNEEVKAHLYAEMLQEGIMPKEPGKEADEKVKEAYGKLGLAKLTLDFAKNLEMYALKGDVSSAIQEFDKYAKATGREPFGQHDLDSLTVYAKYGAPAARENEKQLLARIANVHKQYSANLIKENKLYGLIDQGIENTQYGKAIALKAMYDANLTQHAINKKKAEAKQKKAA